MAVPAQLQYSTAEQVDIVLAYLSAQMDAELASRLYAAQHPGHRVPTRPHSYRHLINLGPLDQSMLRRDQPVQPMILTSMCWHMSQSGRKQVSSKLPAHTERAQLQFGGHFQDAACHPYHMRLHQELRPNDFQKRLDFCNWRLIQCDKDAVFLNSVLWTDQAQFCRDSRDSNVSLHNAHYSLVQSEPPSAS